MKLNYEELEAKCAALAAENAGMDAFVDALLSIAWQGGSADGAEIQELAIKHGLLRQETYSADEHETLVDDPGNFEDGDPVYFRVEAPETDAFLAEVRASGVDALVERRLTAARLAKEAGHEITARDLEGEAIRARVFAMELRKGVQS
ncbi:hypothetical protein SPL90_00850 [Enterobacter hormaechei subsp. xiangfangensis]|uniref:hypothetical protein n=1 Tax=Enterobacter TaxID=547 RepID=UPI000F81F6A7|nr:MULTISPECIES: hypothetical protein [Enterobacter]MBY0608552.1 hypothetical protein [Enterobacter sp. TF2-1-2]MBY0624781.1 hypothetical protein [Enterobacter sp. TF5]MCM7642541.1 hypothetical protein [Enterobacter hormaechei]MCM8083914.1 hypothetical protein [Enterobacter hormaechei]MCO7426958.1 hypothetical protein [Enterobacter hormaechei]